MKYSNIVCNFTQYNIIKHLLYYNNIFKILYICITNFYTIYIYCEIYNIIYY